LLRSRDWKNTSGFWAVPRSTGCSGDRARARWAATRWSSIIARTVSGSTATILATSWEVRKPSKKWITGMRPARVAAWAMRAISWASCTELLARSAQPVARQAITSEWSPKMDSAWVASARAATWSTKGVSSPAIL
jgi:hypothetical protein